MTKIRILFYKAQRDGHIIDDAISLWTKLWNPGTGPYSHTEIWFPDSDGEFERAGHYLGECYTSTMRGEAKGTIIRPSTYVLTNPERWDYIELELEDHIVVVLRALARVYVKANTGYDFLCILGFFLPYRVHRHDKYICSEAVARLIDFVCPDQKKLGILSPRRLSKRLLDRGHVLHKLAVSST